MSETTPEVYPQAPVVEGADDGDLLPEPENNGVLLPTDEAELEEPPT
jgi:hypothetical protein